MKDDSKERVKRTHFDRFLEVGMARIAWSRGINPPNLGDRRRGDARALTGADRPNRRFVVIPGWVGMSVGQPSPFALPPEQRLGRDYLRGDACFGPPRASNIPNELTAETSAQLPWLGKLSHRWMVVF